MVDAADACWAFKLSNDMKVCLYKDEQIQSFTRLCKTELSTDHEAKCVQDYLFVVTMLLSHKSSSDGKLFLLLLN